MSEVKLNLIDSQQVLHGTIHGSITDAAVAALSAEPETIAELQAALARYIKPLDAISPFPSFCSTTVRGAANSIDPPDLDLEPWDAGIVVIDLAARIVAVESTYSLPRPSGQVHCHDGTHSTDVAVPYRVPDDWLFASSVGEYQCSRGRRSAERANRPSLEPRKVLYGRPLLEYIAGAIATLAETEVVPSGQVGTVRIASHDQDHPDFPGSAPGEDERSTGGEPTLPLAAAGAGGIDDYSPVDEDRAAETLAREISNIHARWLMTPRDDLRGQSPRDVLFARQDFIDFDLHTRELQWTFAGEGPPCLAIDSYAYRFAGFGTHEWVVYYDLIRHLLWRALANFHQSGVGRNGGPAGNLELVRQTQHLTGIAAEIVSLEAVRTDWLEQPQREYDGRIPALIIENERKRLPITVSAQDMIIDEDCDLCRMSAHEVAMGLGPGFWHLDGAHMDDDFAFSCYETRQEWEAENRRREEFSKEFNRRWEERQQRLARGEALEPDPFFDPEPFPEAEFDGSGPPEEPIDDDEKKPPH